jgi:hypothetical protein
MQLQQLVLAKDKTIASAGQGKTPVEEQPGAPLLHRTRATKKVSAEDSKEEEEEDDKEAKAPGSDIEQRGEDEGDEGSDDDGEDTDDKPANKENSKPAKATPTEVSAGKHAKEKAANGSKGKAAVAAVEQAKKASPKSALPKKGKNAAKAAVAPSKKASPKKVVVPVAAKAGKKKRDETVHTRQLERDAKECDAQRESQGRSKRQKKGGQVRVALHLNLTCFLVSVSAIFLMGGWYSKLLSGDKRMSRRKWKVTKNNKGQEHLFRIAMQEKTLVRVWDSKHAQSGKPYGHQNTVGYVLVHAMWKEKLGDMPDSDVELEGGDKGQKAESFLNTHFPRISREQVMTVLVFTFFDLSLLPKEAAKY